MRVLWQLVYLRVTVGRCQCGVRKYVSGCANVCADVSVAVRVYTHT